jgi:hypothetical protein
MKPFTYYEQIIKMNNKADKYDLRLRMVKYVMVCGIKPITRIFDTTTPKIVRKWLQRHHQERLSGLNKLPKIPLSCPHKTSLVMEKR